MSKKSKSHKKHSRRTRHRGGGYYLNVGGPMICGMAEVRAVADPLPPAAAPGPFFEYPMPYFDDFKSLPQPLQSGGRRKKSKKSSAKSKRKNKKHQHHRHRRHQRGGMAPFDATAPVPQDQLSFFDDAPTLMNRSFGCTTPYWSATCM